MREFDVFGLAYAVHCGSIGALSATRSFHSLHLVERNVEDEFKPCPSNGEYS